MKRRDFISTGLGFLTGVLWMYFLYLQKPMPDYRTAEYKAVIYGGDQARWDFLIGECERKQRTGGMPTFSSCHDITTHMIEVMNKEPLLRGGYE